jgi:hypothetical protein
MMTLLGIVLVGIYVGGIWKFQQGFRVTNFSDGLVNRIYLSLMWPALLLTSKSYRQNFNRALKGE